MTGKLDLKAIKEDVLRVLVSKTHLGKVVSNADLATLEKIENVTLAVLANRKDVLLDKEKEKLEHVEKMHDVESYAASVGLTPRQLAEYFSGVKTPKAPKKKKAEPQAAGKSDESNRSGDLPTSS